MPTVLRWRAALVAAAVLVPTAALIAVPASAADPGRLTGTVVNDSGAVLAGASVRLLDGSGAVVAHTIANGDGAYSLTAPKESYRLAVTHAHRGGWAKATVRNVAVGSATALDVVAVAPPVHLRGRVSIPGFPDATASVRLAGVESYAGSAGDDDRYDVAAKPGVYDLSLRVTVNSGSVGGTFEFSAGSIDLSGDRTLDVDIALRWVTVGAPDNGGPLKPGTELIIGTDPDVPPIALGPSVTARPSFSARGTTDASGFVRLPYLPTPKLTAMFRTTPWDEEDSSLWYRQTGIDARQPDSRIELGPYPTASFAARFTDDAGNAIRGGTLKLNGAGGTVEKEIDNDGRVTAEVPVGRYSVNLSGRTVHGPTAQLAIPDFDLTMDRTTTFRLPLRTSTVVVRRADNSVPDASVSGGTGNGRFTPAWTPVATEFPGSTATMHFGTRMTDLSGRATIVGPAGAPLGILVRPPAGTNLGVVAQTVAGDATVTTVRLPDGAPVQGRVQMPTEVAPNSVNVGMPDNLAVFSTVPDSQGRFSLDAAPGPARLTLTGSGPLADVSTTSWDLSGGVTFEPAHTLEVTVPAVTTDLRFVDEDGRPLDAWAEVDAAGQVVLPAGTFAGQAKSRTGPVKASDRIYVRSLPGSTGSVRVSSLVRPELTWIRATGVPLTADGRVTLAVGVATSDSAGAVATPSTTTTTQPSNPSPGGGPTTTTTAPSDSNKAALPIGSGRSGYWMVTAAGAVHAFGDAKNHGEPTGALGGARAVRLEPTPTGRGYWILDRRGVVHAFGDAAHHGNVNRTGLAAEEAPTSLSATPTGKGYWVFTTHGRVLNFGDAGFYGDVSTLRLNGPILGSVATPTGRGYYMVASDGGIFTFGDARFHGSTGSLKLNKPVMGMAPAGDGSGYWLVASDGGIFAFGVPFHGSMGALPLNRPISGIVPGRVGYLMVAEDGGIFSFGQVAFHGSLGASPPPSPVVSAALLP